MLNGVAGNETASGRVTGGGALETHLYYAVETTDLL